MQIVARKIDKLGRIVLPMDFRKALGLGIEAEVILGIEGRAITVKSAHTACKLCGTEQQPLNGMGICCACTAKIKAL